MGSDDRKGKRGELVPRDDGGALRPWEGRTPELSYPPRRTVWGNRLQKGRIESVDEMIAAATRLVNTLYQHEFAKARFHNVYYDIQHWMESEKFRREIEIEDLQIQLLHARKQRRQLEGGGEDEGEDKYQKRLEEARRKREFEAEMKVLDATSAFGLIERLKQERERIREALMRGVSGELTEEQRLQLENLDDLFQKLMDEVR